MKQIILNQITPEEFKSLISEAIRKEISNISQGGSNPKKEIYGTRKQIAKALHISLPTLYDLTKTGILQGYKLHGRVLYKWEEIEKSLQKINSLQYKRSQ